MALALSCPGELAVVAQVPDSEGYSVPSVSCSVEWSVSEVSASLPISAIEPAHLAEYFSLGFAFVLMFWALGKGASLVLSMIRR